ncbi:mannan-binding lectin serine protease 2 [Pangasianodon hypophthalmus]|uniref:mannan-binding lectin serine protease 2 n=1 Tax=Pangasianodon hypophthalmus TaxID=310915 RepID=UPI0023072510|nr:mannan-binding lectin serine protease 2 [Pangasianodon hypophthalmus]
MQADIVSSTMLIFCVCALLVSVCQSLPIVGWIQSPGYPHGYGSDISETWKRCAPPGHVLSLRLLHLDLEESYECENDVLKISEDHNLLANLCGRMTLEELQSSVNPSLRSSSGGCLSLTFQSDYSNTERHAGFKAFYTTQDVDECWENDVVCSHFCHNYIGGYSCSCKPGYYLDEDQHECRANCTEERYGAGVLKPPGSPGPYFENADCLFSLSVDEGNQLELKFTGVFDVESRDGRCVDFLKIKTDTETFGPFCGKNRPADILTAAQHVKVIFHSDLEGTNQGFSLEYKPKGMECSGKVTPDSTVSPVRDRYQVGETVTVRCVTGYVLIDSTETFTSTCQLNGRWSPIYSCESVNCGHPELPDLMDLTEDNPQTLYEHTISVKCSSEYYKLDGNANFTCDATGEWVAENRQTFSQHTPQCVPVCGITTESARKRIFGGENATLGQIPWQLLVKEPHRGGASLINDRWAITAAHVVENQRSLIFAGGMVNARAKEKVEMQTEKIIIHPGYKKPNFDNDIALVKMSSRVPLSENLIPVCLPEKKTNGPTMEGKMGTVSGFGATDKRIKSPFLQYGHVKEYPGFCFQSNLKVTDNMFCAGDADGGVDSCKGDSGGPLVIPLLGFGSLNTPYRLKGIVSWGPPVCGNRDYKGYYTKVENYLDWIREMMEKN